MKQKTLSATKMSSSSSDISIVGIKNPKAGVNYDPLLIQQAIPDADIIKWVSELSKKLPKTVKYAIVPNPETGAIIYYLMQTKLFEGVYTFAKGKSKKYLQNNLKEWKLDDVVDISSDFRPTEIASGLPESVVLLEVKDKLSDELVQGTLTLLKKAAMISIYSLVEMDPLSLGFVTQLYRDQVSKQRAIYYFLTTFEWNEKKEKEWYKSLHTFLKGFLPKFMPEKFVPKFLTPDAMKLWRLAFTTESIDPTQNSEDIEMLGDGLLDYCVVRHMYQRVPDIKKSQVNEMKSRWVNKPFLGTLSTQLGLVDHVATVKVTKHVREDVFESFIGAMIYIADDLVTPGLSYIMVKKFVDFVYLPIKLGPNVDDIPTGPGKTLVPQYFGRIGLNPDSVHVEMTKDPTTFITHTTVSINNDTRKALANLGIKLNSNILGTAEDIDPKISEKYAYTMAYDTIEAAGMNESWVKKTNQLVIFNHPEIQPYYKAALKKAKSLGYTDIKLMSSAAQRSNKSEVALLIGIEENGNQERIATGVGTERYASMADAMKKFVEE